MSEEQNKLIARRLPMELAKGNLGILDQVVAPNAVDHAVPPGMPETVESTKKFYTTFRTAFPDIAYTLDDEIAEGDLVVQRVTSSATMKGNFMGMPPTGKRATWTEIHTVRFKDGKVVEHWANIDQAGMMMQLGLMSMPGS